MAADSFSCLACSSASCTWLARLPSLKPLVRWLTLSSSWSWRGPSSLPISSKSYRQKTEALLTLLGVEIEKKRGWPIWIASCVSIYCSHIVMSMVISLLIILGSTCVCHANKNIWVEERTEQRDKVKTQKDIPPFLRTPFSWCQKTQSWPHAEYSTVDWGFKELQGFYRFLLDWLWYLYLLVDVVRKLVCFIQ